MSDRSRLFLVGILFTFILAMFPTATQALEAEPLKVLTAYPNGATTRITPIHGHLQSTHGSAG